MGEGPLGQGLDGAWGVHMLTHPGEVPRSSVSGQAPDLEKFPGKVPHLRAGYRPPSPRALPQLSLPRELLKGREAPETMALRSSGCTLQPSNLEHPLAYPSHHPPGKTQVLWDGSQGGSGALSPAPSPSLPCLFRGKGTQGTFHLWQDLTKPQSGLLFPHPPHQG